MHRRIYLLLLLSIIVGCAETPPTLPREADEQEVALAKAFDAQATGTIRGVVRWDGDAPIAVEQVVRAHATNPFLHQNPAHFTLPHYPKVEAKSRGVENAVVFLRKVESQHSKPWDYAPVQVEIHARQMHIAQGERRAAVGFVRRGDAIEMVNRDADYHNLIGRGVAFFAEPLIEKDRVSKRTLTQSGVVDLQSGNGYFWMHAHLFVAEHPYYTCTDRAGRFTLEQVPAGTYELVCWLPSWHVRQKEHDPETGTLVRLAWEAPQELMRTLEVQTGKEVDVEYRWNCAAFK